MSVADLPLFSVLKSRMRWLEKRQKVIAENVANADTPHYRGRDLKQLDFNAELNATVQAQVQLAATSPGHITAPASDTTHLHGPRGGFETKPSGNAVVLERPIRSISREVSRRLSASSFRN